MEKFGYVFAAFVIVWLALCTYVFFMGQTQKKLGKEIEELKSLVVKNQKK
jgi:CcmD family protein